MKQHENLFAKSHPRHTCPRCGKPNHLPNESLPENAGARVGVNLHAEISHPSLWKANGGPGTVTTKRARLCWKCGAYVVLLLRNAGFLDVDVGNLLETTCE